jgi:hypothetical protein
VEVLNENVDEFFQSGSSSYICTSCHRSLTNFAEFKRQINSKHRIAVKLEEESAEFITLGLDDIKHELLEPEYVVVKESENLDRFTCSEDNCHREFFSQKSLIVHKNRCHSQDKRFWCCKCDRKFTSKKEMLKCQKLHALEVIGCVKCPDCSSNFSSQSQMISHRNRVHGTNIFYCKPCDITYETKAELVRCQKLHYANKIAGIYINCPKCDKKLKKYSLHLHLKFFHEKKRDQQCQVSEGGSSIFPFSTILPTDLREILPDDNNAKATHEISALCREAVHLRSLFDDVCDEEVHCLSHEAEGELEVGEMQRTLLNFRLNFSTLSTKFIAATSASSEAATNPN